MMRTARPGPGERLAPDDPLGQAELVADRAHLVLEQHAQRLDELEAPSRSGRPPTLWWLLIFGAPVPPCRDLDHVGVERALDEELRRRRACCASSSKTRMNSSPMILRLRSGSVTPASLLEEALARRRRAIERDAEAASRNVSTTCSASFLRIMPVVDEHAGEPVADRLVHEQRRRPTSRRRPTGRRSTLPSPTCSRMRCDLLLDDRGRRPVGLAAAAVVEEVAQHVHAARRVHDLGVELHGVEAALAVFHRRDRRAAVDAEHREARGRRRDAVAVAHPALLFAVESVEQQPPSSPTQSARLAELARAGARRPCRRGPGPCAGRRSRCRAPGCRARSSAGSASGASST